MSVDRWLGRWRAQAIPRFITPVMTVVRDAESDEPPDLDFIRLCMDAVDFESPKRRLLIGPAGSGKTSVLLQLAADVASEDVLVCFINAALIRSVRESDDYRDLLRAFQPDDIDEALWRARIKHGRVLVLLDGVDDIEYRLSRTGNSRRWRDIVGLLTAPHAFPVVATARFMPDELFDDDVNSGLEVVRLLSVPRTAAATFLQQSGLQPEAAFAKIRAADLGGLAGNPLFLTLIEKHLLETSETQLPSSRAGLLLSEYRRAAKRSLLEVPRELRERGLDPEAAFLTVALLSFARGGASIPVSDAVAVLSKVWPSATAKELRGIVNALSVNHLVVSEMTAVSLDLRPLHQLLVEFVLARVWRETGPPPWALTKPDLEHVLGDWVALQDDPSAAAVEAAAICHRLRRPARILDIVGANRSIIDRAAKVRIWKDLGRYLTPDVKPHLRLALGKALEHTPRIVLDEAVDAGLLVELERVSQSLAQKVGTALASGTFNQKWLHRALKELQSGSSRSLPRAGLHEESPRFEWTEAAQDEGPESLEPEALADTAAEDASESDKDGRYLLFNMKSPAQARLRAARRFAAEAGLDETRSLLEGLQALRRRSIAKSAITDLLAAGNENTISHFSTFLSDPGASSSIRRWIVECIDDRLAAAFEPALIAASSDSTLSMATQMRCVRLISTLETESAKLLLKRLIRHDDDGCRTSLSTLRILRQSEAESSAELIIEAIGDEAVPIAVRAAALEGEVSLDRWLHPPAPLSPALLALLSQEVARRESLWLRQAEDRYDTRRNWDSAPPELEVEHGDDPDGDSDGMPNDKDLQRRISAIIDAALSDDIEKQSAFRALLTDHGEDHGIRAAAAWALGALHDSAAAPILSELLRKESEPAILRAAAALTLARLGDESAAPHIAEVTAFLSVPDACRTLFIKALATFEGPAYTATLARVATDKAQGEMCQMAALRCLAKRESGKAIEEVARIAESPLQAVRVRLGAIAACEPHLRSTGVTLRTLASSMSEPTPVRLAALDALMRAPERPSIAALEAALLDKTLPRYTRADAAISLGRIGDPTSVAALANGLVDTTLSSSRRHIATALGWIGGPAATKVLAEAASLDLDHLSMFYVAQALGRSGGSRAIDALAGLMLDTDRPGSIRSAAANALGSAGDCSATAALIEIVERRIPSSRTTQAAAVSALARVGDDAAVDPLLAILSNRLAASPMRQAAARGLAHFRDPRCVRALREVALDDSASTAVRMAALRALGNCGGMKNAEILRGIAEDTTIVANLRIVAILAYGKARGSIDEWTINVAANANYSNVSGMTPSQFRGAILKAASAVGKGLPWIPFFEHVARNDRNWGNRTIAALALARRRALDHRLVHDLLAEANRPPRTGRDINSTHIPKICIRAAVLATADEEADSTFLFTTLMDFMCHPRRSSAQFAALFDALESLSLPEAQRLYNAILASGRRRLGEDHPLMKRALEYKRQLDERAHYQMAEEQFLARPEVVVWEELGMRPRKVEPENGMRTALLITATVRERRAVLSALKDLHEVRVEEVKLDGIWLDEFNWPPAPASHWRVFLAQPVDKGPLPMQEIVSNMCRELQPEIVFLVGCCAGFHERGASKGDVIVARRIFGYQRRTHRGGAVEQTPDPYRTGSNVIDLVNKVVTRPGFGLAGGAELHLKDFASTDDLIDDDRSGLRAAIKKLSPEIYGFEMEGQGFGYALQGARGGSAANGVLIKGVSDYGDGAMRSDKDVLQASATANALQFALMLLEAAGPEDGAAG